jgi:hypothetical protein
LRPPCREWPYEPDACGLLLTCTGGGEGKCIRFGYYRWASAVDRMPMRDAYSACVRPVRADYAGEGLARLPTRLNCSSSMAPMRSSRFFAHQERRTAVTVRPL